MGTVPTDRLERRLRAFYVSWVQGLSQLEDHELESYLEYFESQTKIIIQQEGGEILRRGRMAGFPDPEVIPLSLNSDYVYDQLKLAAIQAGIGTGLSTKEIARVMHRAGLGNTYSNLERLARTEVVSAYWAQQWSQVKDLDLVMLWSAENGPRTCPQCLAKDGLIVKDPSIRDHPNGRCTLLPTYPSKVPIRSKTRNPRFTRNHVAKRYPLPENKLLNQALRGESLDQPLVASGAVNGAVTGMVGQGWSSSEALTYLLTYQNNYDSLSRSDRSLAMRRLELIAQHLYDGLERDAAPSVLYRGGHPSPTGMSSWSSNRDVASLYALRNKRILYKATTPKGLYSYKVDKGVNSDQSEYIVLGMPTPAKSRHEQGLQVIESDLSGGTDLVTMDQALASLKANR